MRRYLVVLFPLCLFASSPCASPDHLKAAQCYWQASDWRASEAEFRLALQSDADSAQAAAGHARSLVKLNHPFDALIELEQFLSTQPGALEPAKLYAALCDGVLTDHLKAQEALERAAREAPDDPEVWRALGTHYLDRAKPEDAVRCFERAVALNKNDALSLASLAYAHGQLGDEPKARAEFAAALNRNKVNPEAAVFLVYGEFLLRHSQPRESVEYFDKAIQIDPHLGEVYYERAIAHEAHKEFEQAKADALAALRESGERVDAHIILQRIYRKMGDAKSLQDETDKIVAITSAKEEQQALGRQLRANLNKAEPLLREQKFAETIPFYEEIVRILPEFYEAWFALAVSYAQTGRPQQSEAAFRRFLTFQPLSADGRAGLGLLLLQQNRPAEARKELEEALRLDPTMEEVKAALAHLTR